MSRNDKECPLPQLKNGSRIDSIYKQFSKMNLHINDDFGFMKELEAVLKKNKGKEDNLDEVMEIFDRFISGFKTYKPFLRSIKQIFERTVLNLRQDIDQINRELHSWRLLAEQNETKLITWKQEHSKESSVLKKEILKMKKLFNNFYLARHSHEKQIQKLSDELTQTYKSYLDEKSARKLLSVEVGKLEKKHGDEIMKLQTKFERRMVEIDGGEGGGIENLKTNDPVLLKILLKKTKANEEDAFKKLEELRKIYDDDDDDDVVVSKKVFETIMQEKLSSLDNLEERLKDKEGRSVNLTDEPEVMRKKKLPVPKLTWTLDDDEDNDGVVRTFFELDLKEEA